MHSTYGALKEKCCIHRSPYAIRSLILQWVLNVVYHRIDSKSLPISNRFASSPTVIVHIRCNSDWCRKKHEPTKKNTSRVQLSLKWSHQITIAVGMVGARANDEEKKTMSWSCTHCVEEQEWPESQMKWRTFAIRINSAEMQKWNENGWETWICDLIQFNFTWMTDII